ncbi:MAG: CaiB/BaiF CoA transferase family protein [Acidimicrobiia bacterium]
MQPLEGLVVIDLSEWIAAPYCTKLLADYGARVIKVERPGGDPSRTMGPFPGDVADPERSGMFLNLNTNKESVVIDVSVPAGAALVKAMAVKADIVVESFAPGSMASWGLAPRDLVAANPRLVVTSLTPFGQTGPYRNWQMTEIVAFAMGGMSASGVADREPVKLAGNVVMMQSGATACVATLGALFHAEEHGAGQHVDVATFETQNGSLDRRRYYLLSYEYSGTIAERVAGVGSGRPDVGGRFQCSDGTWVTSGRIWPTHAERAVALLDDPALRSLYESGVDILADEGPRLNGLLAKWASQRTARQAMREAQAIGFPVVVVNDPHLILSDDHLLARGFWATAKHPVAGEVVYTGAPWKVDGGGWAIHNAAPLLGQHTDAVLTELARMSGAELAALRNDGVIA